MKQIFDYLQRCKQRSESEMSAHALTMYEMIYELKPKTVLEIGVNRAGVSTHIITGAMWAISQRDENYDGHLYSIDIKDFSSAIAPHNKISKFWTFIQADSRKFYKTWDKGEIDILLIDGDHSYKGILLDLENYFPLVKKGGYVLLHDTSHGSVEVFWRDIKYSSKLELKWFYGVGIIHKI